MVLPTSPDIDAGHNPYFDSGANYTVTGHWTFAIQPSFPLPPGSFSPTTSYDGTFGNQPAISGSWLHQGPFNVQAGAGNVVLQSTLGQVQLLAPNAGQTIVASADNLNFSANNQAGISASQMFLTSNGPLSLTSLGGDVAVSVSGDFLVSGIPAAVTAQQLYYNSISGVVSYGAAGGGGGGFTWSSIAGAAQALVAANGYIAKNVGLTTFTLPAVAAVGDEFQIQGYGAGGWMIAQNAGQRVGMGVDVSTIGVGGSVASTDQYDSIRLVCVTANTEFVGEFAVGTLNFV